MRHRAALLLAAAGALALPGAASADVFLKVPRAFLGGPIWPALPAVSPEASGRPSAAPPPASDACRGVPGDCVVVGPGADVDAVPLPAPGPGGIGAPVDDVGVEDDPAPDEDTPGVGAEGRAAQEALAAPAMPPDLALVQTYTLRRVTRDAKGRATVRTLGRNLLTPPNNVGPRSTPDYESLVAPAVHTLKDGTRVFAGQRDDPFFVDFGGRFDLLGFWSAPPAPSSSAAPTVRTATA